MNNKIKYKNLIGNILLIITVLLPSLYHSAGASSMAAGALVISIPFILFFIRSYKTLFRIQGVRSVFLFITVVYLVIIMHGLIASILYYREFDLIRFSFSIILLFIYFFGAITMATLTNKINDSEAHFIIRNVFCVIIILSLGVLARYSPYSPYNIHRSELIRTELVIFSEPSHYVLIFLSFFLYIVVYATSVKRKIQIIILGYLLAILIQSLTMILSITVVAFISLRIRTNLLLGTISLVLILFYSPNLDYYKSRLNFFNDEQNLSVMVLLSGWERAIINLNNSNGLGVGFQQFGVIGDRGEIMESVSKITTGETNLFDGGTVASKLIGEFGVLGIMIIILYINNIVKFVKWIHNVSISKVEPRESKMLFFVSCFIMYSTETFVRGAGYFTSSGFLFLASISWILIRQYKKSMITSSQNFSYEKQ